MANQADEKKEGTGKEGAGPCNFATKGPVTQGIIKVIDWLGKETSIWCGFYPRRDYGAERNPTPADISRWTRRVEFCVLGWWVGSVASYLTIYYHWWYIWYLCGVAMVCRVVNIVSFNLRVALVETTRSRSGAALHLVISAKRSVILGFANFCELIICFGGLYAAFPDLIAVPGDGAKDIVTFIYLSVITQLTIGYGDVSPLGWMRLVVGLQGLSGLLLITLTIGRFVSLIRFVEYGVRPRDP